MVKLFNKSDSRDKGDAVKSARTADDCENEPIHLLNTAQAHGVLLACNKKTRKIVAFSSNAPDLLGVTHAQLTTSTIDMCLPISDYWESVFNHAQSGQVLGMGEVELRGNHSLAEMIVHIEPNTYGERLIIELIPIDKSDIFSHQSDMDLLPELIRAMQDLENTTSIHEFASRSVNLVQKISGYDRVLLYRFAEDWSGEVIGEQCAKGIEQRFLGLHFPASDIPKQARELYTKNLIRVIADVDAAPISLSMTGQKGFIDQSYCLLRQPSEMHILYCKNMGVRATLTISLMYDNKLWGMLACHHFSPKTPRQELRRSVLQICHLASYALACRLASIIRLNILENKQKRRDYLETIPNYFFCSEDLIDYLPKLFNELPSLINASCTAIKFNHVWHKQTPIDDQILEALLREAKGKPLVVDRRNQLQQISDRFAATNFSGAVVFPIPGLNDRCLIALREEIETTVLWGGNPNKANETLTDDDDGNSIIGPRKSFDRWSQEIKGKCEPWDDNTLSFIRSLTSTLGNILLSIRLREADKKLLFLGNSMIHIQDMVILLEPSQERISESKIIYVNNSVLDKTQLQESDLLGKPLSRLIYNPTELDAAFDAAHKSNTFVTTQLQIKQNDSAMVDGETTITPIINQQNKKPHYVAIIRDISERLRNEEKLKYQNNLIEQVTSHIPGLAFHLEKSKFGQYQIHFANGTMKEILTSLNNKGDLSVRSALKIIDISDRKKLKKMFSDSIATQQTFSITLRCSELSPKDIQWIELHASPYLKYNGAISWYGFVYNVTQRIESERSIEQLSVNLNTTISAIPDILIEVDENRRITRFQSGGQIVLPMPTKKLIGKNLCDVFSASETAIFENAFNYAQTHGACHGWELSMSVEEEKYFLELELSVSIKRNASGRTLGYICIARDITERKLAEERIRELAYFDPLTGLFNRRAFFDRFTCVESESERHRTWFALIYIDLDNFKNLNDTKGHSYGDLLLKQLGKRLCNCIRDEDIIARMGGDEFVVLTHGLANEDEASITGSVLAKKFLSAIEKPFDLEAFTYRVTCSIGIAIAGFDKRASAEDILKNADMAMYRAKGRGKAGWCFYDSDVQLKLTIRNQQEQDLRTAIESQELSVFYQPIVDRQTKIVGYEALIRWRQEDGHYVDPGSLIELAEQSDLIVQIGDFVLREAVQVLEQWQLNPATRDWTLSLNVSARQIQKADFIEALLSTLRARDIDPKKLTLELTETLLQNNLNETITLIGELSKAGIQFALDDFGTGYSSLSYLKRLPIQKLKIDRSFICDITHNEDNKAIPKMIIHLAKTLGREVVAEGIELEEQHQLLLELGCDYFQGYIFGSAEPLEGVAVT